MPRRTALLALLLVVAAACGDSDQSVFSLEVGDCFDDATLEPDAISEVPIVPCDEPHDNEIYFEYTTSGNVFPGRDALVQEAARVCIDEFEPFVGRSYATSALDVFPITPTASSWENGDRVVYCALYALDLSKLTGSMRGSGR